MRNSLQQLPPQKQVQVYLSNKLENLYEAIKANLFLNSAPFSHRWVIIPSMQMEEWLSWKLAKDPEIKISAGINFSFLSNGIASLSKMLFQKPFIAPFSEVALTLKIFNIISDQVGSDDPLWAPLEAYLKRGSQKKREERLIGLASRLAPLFLRYPIYGEGVTKKWIKTPKNWQEAAYKALFEKRPTLLEEITSATFKEGAPPDLSIHLFSFSHIPTLYFSLFEKIATHVPLSIYHFSPCEIFWTDTVSEKGKRWLLAHYKKKEVSSSSLMALLEALDEAHPLLANLGRVGKAFAYEVEEREFPTHELYDEKIQPTLLGAIQRDILLVEPSLVTHPNDGSIEIHIHSTPHREIENLAYQLQGENPGEVLVLAKDISLYEPFIKAHFKNYKITDLPMKRKNETVGGLFVLLSLPKRRWSSLALLELFDHPLFRNKQGITDEEVSLIRKWVQETGIRWGLDSSSQKCTWRDGIDKLFLALCTWEDETLIDITHTDLLQKLILLLNSLEKDLAPISDGTRKTLGEWSSYLINLIETYFDFSPDEIGRLEKLKGDHLSLPFDALFPLIEKELSKESAILGRHNLGCITFSSMLPMRSIPAKVICLLGMDHTFPRSETLFSLDLLGTEKTQYYPTQSDFDKYLFLEALLSARSRVLISYVGQNPVDGALIPPSPLVSELQSIVADRYGQKIKERVFPPHPPQERAKKPLSPFFVKKNTSFLPEGNHTLSIQELTQIARSPIRSYFKEHLQLYFKEQKEIKEEEEFILTPYLLAKMRRDLLIFSPSLVKKEAKKRGVFPMGPLGLYAEAKLEKEVETLEIPNPDDVVICELSEVVTTPDEIALGRWRFPSLRVELNPNCVVSISGQLGAITPKGYLIPEKKGVRGALTAWPSFLLFSKLPKFGSKDLIFGRDGKIVSPFFNDPLPQLKHFLEFALMARECPYLFLPEWIPPLIKGDETGLISAIHRSDSFDPAIAWLCRREWEIDPKEMIEEYRSLVTRVYGEVIDAWF